MNPDYAIDSPVFELEDRGYSARASYLLPPNSGETLVEIFKDGQLLRSFLFPAYKIWNIAAHFGDIVDGEIDDSEEKALHPAVKLA